MEKVFYNKLIRDKVPGIMEAKGKAFEIRKLNDKEFEKELVKKVEEEASGLQNAQTREELIGEMADVIDVIEEIKKLKNISDEEIKTERLKNMEKKGGFDEKIFLVWSEKDDYQSNEIKR
jgi:predicted house-cleaning noncanonical NTP pyrophosphatase (MazG superfamily)